MAKDGRNLFFFLEFSESVPDGLPRLLEWEGWGSGDGSRGAGTDFPTFFGGIFDYFFFF